MKKFSMEIIPRESKT